ncbi:hypothetical protein DSO57_1036681 [Entomophthora muscae]|uniref:Uncharacterized protein n=1 Tax=Entomophthora muscae TaxID=34485 RepID=A0ACC2RQ35_9FUNG|nr:hypothetical protein DSO57_1036681 [Entomophthora muscae]
MPFYFLAKSIFLVWLFHSYFRVRIFHCTLLTNQGAEIIYTKFLKNALTQATPFIDSYVGRAKEAIVIVSDEIKKD